MSKAKSTFEVTVEVGAITPALGFVARISERKNTIPILKFTKLVAEGSSLKFYATDLDVRACVPAPVASVTVPGTALVPTARFFELLKLSAEKDVAAIVANEKETRVTIGRHVSVFKTEPVHEYPIFPDIGTGPSCDVEANTLRRMIGRVEKTVSSDSSSPIGVEFFVSDGTLRLRSLHSHRGSDSKSPIATGAPLLFVWPKHCLDDLASFLPDVGTVRVGIEDGAAFAIDGERILHARTLDHVMSNLDRVIPKSFDGDFVVDRDVLLRCVRRVSQVQHGDSASVALTLDISADLIKLSATASGVGDADEEIVVTTSGAPAKLDMNTKYLIDFLQSCDDGECRFEFTSDAMRPLRCTQPHEVGTSSLMVIMPIRL